MVFYQSAKPEVFMVAILLMASASWAQDSSTPAPQDQGSLEANTEAADQGPIDSKLLKDFPNKTNDQGPLQTFERWRQAAVAGDIEAMVQCYASFKQKEVRKRLKKVSKKKRRDMQEATARTQFVPMAPFYQGDRAVVEVNWKIDLHNDTQMLQFFLENGVWKLLD